MLVPRVYSKWLFGREIGGQERLEVGTSNDLEEKKSTRLTARTAFPYPSLFRADHLFLGPFHAMPPCAIDTGRIMAKTESWRILRQEEFRT